MQNDLCELVMQVVRWNTVPVYFVWKDKIIASLWLLASAALPANNYRASCHSYYIPSCQCIQLEQAN